MNTPDTHYAPARERLESLDMLRGFAVLGILMMNVQSMGNVFAFYMNPDLLGVAGEREHAIWWVQHTFFHTKFITIFTALFGVGIVLFAGTVRDKAREALFRRRVFWLFLFGMAHCYLLWYGDVLVLYSIIGFLALAARKWSIKRLVITAACLLPVSFALFASMLGMQFMAPEDLAEAKASFWTMSSGDIAASVSAVRESWVSRIVFDAPEAIQAQIFSFLLMGPRTFAVMLLGMAIFKAGWLDPKRAPVVLMLAIGALGVAGSVWSTVHMAADRGSFFASLEAELIMYWASLAHALGYAGVIVLACRSSALKRLLYPFTAAGRMAFTNYLSQSLIAAFVFYGVPGFGLFGTYGREGLLVFVLAVWALQLVWSPLWLSLFRFGPLEWVWRSLTYSRAQPMRG